MFFELELDPQSLATQALDKIRYESITDPDKIEAMLQFAGASGFGVLLLRVDCMQSNRYTLWCTSNRYPAFSSGLSIEAFLRGDPLQAPMIALPYYQTRPPLS